MRLGALLGDHPGTAALKNGSIASDLISGSVFELLKNPHARDRLTADWSRAGLAVEEFLRSSLRCNSQSRATCGRTSSLTAFASTRATG